MYRDMCIRRVHKTSSYACLRFTLERERQTITVSSLSVMTAIKKNKSEQREREWWLFAILKVVVGWPLPEADLWTGPGAGVGARLLEFGSNRPLSRGKDRCKFRCKDAYLWQHLFPCPSSPPPPKLFLRRCSPGGQKCRVHTGQAWWEILVLGLRLGEETGCDYRVFLQLTLQAQLLWKGWRVLGSKPAVSLCPKVSPVNNVVNPQVRGFF